MAFLSNLEVLSKELLGLVATFKVSLLPLFVC